LQVNDIIYKNPATVQPVAGFLNKFAYFVLNRYKEPFDEPIPLSLVLLDEVLLYAEASIKVAFALT